MPYDRSYERAPLDPWGLPPTSASRRDSEDMLSRVSRSEAESSEAYRRIEEHLRTVARRLDSAERSQSENNRAMNKTATEINIATREQAQAFDQLGGHVMNIGDRLERLERSRSAIWWPTRFRAWAGHGASWHGAWAWRPSWPWGDHSAARSPLKRRLKA